jgi:p-hydroxybenzoate 3-monooxygenase
MTATKVCRTQVGIVGAGPAGLVLGHLLALGGVDAVVLEDRSRAHVESRQRAGILENDVARLLRDVGLGERMDREGMAHQGIYLQFDGERHRIDFHGLTGRDVWVWAQTEVVKDLVASRLAAGLPLEFEVRDTLLHDATGDQPRITYVDRDGRECELVCDVIAGCDGFHGPSRAAVPSHLLQVQERSYPYAWLGIIADVAPSTDELIYAHHPEGFALHSVRTPEVSRLYVQVRPDEDIGAWPDDRIWAALQRRFAVPGWTLQQGPIREKGITAMRSFVASPMRHGRLFLAGDAAHIVPPTGAKGLNLAVADVVVLANALVAWLRNGDGRLVDAYAETCLRRAWQATHFSWWMTSMMHTPPGQDPFDARLQLAQLRHVTSSQAASTDLALRYTGQPLPPLQVR